VITCAQPIFLAFAWRFWENISKLAVGVSNIGVELCTEIPEYEEQIREFRSESCSEVHGLTFIQRFLTFLVLSTKLRNTTIGFLMSVRFFVCPRGTTRLQLDELSSNLIFDSFLKIGLENSSFIKIRQE
jgi:hypothetical protein